MPKQPSDPPKEPTLAGSPSDPPQDPNLAGFRAILEQKKKNKAAAEVAKPSDLTHKQKPRPKPKMRRRP